MTTPVYSQPDYWQEACADLIRQDRILRKLIPCYGPIQFPTTQDPFVTLTRAILGQQISVKAAQGLWDRLRTAYPDFSSESVYAKDLKGLQEHGIPKRKAEYIFELATQLVHKKIAIDSWHELSDAEVIKAVTQIRGIGPWSAQMFLIFYLWRPDVFPIDDLGLIKAIAKNYFSNEPVTRQEVREIAVNWTPWRTVATWYLWRSLDPIPVTY